MDTTVDNPSSFNPYKVDGIEAPLSTPETNWSNPRSLRLSYVVYFSNSSDTVCISSNESAKQELTNFLKLAKTRMPAFLMISVSYHGYRHVLGSKQTLC